MAHLVLPGRPARALVGLLAVGLVSTAGCGESPSMPRNENAALDSLRALATAQRLFRDGDKDANGKRDFAPSLGALGSAGLIDPQLATGTQKGYLFVIDPAPTSTTRWAATANPTEPGVTGARYLFVDETGVIRLSTTGAATSRSPVCWSEDAEPPAPKGP